MNAKKLIALIATAVAASAFAGENIEGVEHGNFVPTKTRAEVRAELEKAHAQGFRPGSNPEWVEFSNVPSTMTRDAVLKEAARPGK
jgi:hypothetical protein